MVPVVETAVSIPTIAFAKGHLSEVFPNAILALAQQQWQLCHHQHHQAGQREEVAPAC